MDIDSRSTPDLTGSELNRYSRHLLLPEVGAAGQKRLKAARVLIVGAGGLGSPCALYLAAAGVGRLGIVDFDSVALSNLQRQIIYSQNEVGTAKAESAARRLAALNQEIEVVPYNVKLTSSNAQEILAPYDIVIDGTDNFGTRYLINDACVLYGKPNVYGSIYRFEGQVSVFAPPKGPCYRCLFPQAPPEQAVPNCAEGGVLGVLAGTIGVLQATEALKLILNIGDPLIGRLLLYNALPMQMDLLRVKRKESCPVCGISPSITDLTDEQITCGTAPSVQAHHGDISARELKDLLDGSSPPLLLDVRNENEYVVCHLPDALWIPLDQLHIRKDELDGDRETVVYCRSGVRSAKAVEMLATSGFKNVRHLAGGILAWAQEIDNSLPV